MSRSFCTNRLRFAAAVWVCGSVLAVFVGSGCRRSGFLAREVRPQVTSDHLRQEIPGGEGSYVTREGHSNEQELFSKALSLSQAHDVAGAEKVYTQIVGLEPDNAPGYLGLATCRLEVRDLDGAEKQYQKALSLDPSYNAAMVGLGTVWAERHKSPVARQWYLRALKANPASADANYGVANTFLDEGNEEAAVPYLQEVIRLAPGSEIADYSSLRLHAQAKTAVERLHGSGKRP